MLSRQEQITFINMFIALYKLNNFELNVNRLIFFNEKNTFNNSYLVRNEKATISLIVIFINSGDIKFQVSGINMPQDWLEKLPENYQHYFTKTPYGLCDRFLLPHVICHLAKTTK